MLATDLTSLQIFRGLDDQNAKRICEALDTMNFEADENILTEGDDTQALWIILSGECVVSRACSVDDHRILAVLTAGDVFGEMSFVRTAPHSASIRSATAVTACCYRREHFLQLARQHPEAAYQICGNISAVLAERLRRMDTWVCDLFDGSDDQDYRDEWQNFRSAVYTNWNF